MVGDDAAREKVAKFFAMQLFGLTESSERA
jgi:hypothetical protein